MSDDPLAHVSHRPWPLPSRPWVMAQVWHDLLFAHWRVPAAEVRSKVPAELEVDTRDGSAWLGVVPFRMSGVRLRGLPPLPGTGAFPELNVRTYVNRDGRPGVWFFSLDAASRIAVAAARAWFHLPYFRARMRCESAGDAVRYGSERRHCGAPPAALTAEYEPAGPVQHAAAGTLEHWLTERYCLYARAPDGRVWRGDIHHRPWPLQPARASIGIETMSSAAGFAPLAGTPHLLFARHLDVRIFAPARIAV